MQVTVCLKYLEREKNLSGYTGLTVNTLPNTKQLEQYAGLPPAGGGEGCIWHTGGYYREIIKCQSCHDKTNKLTLPVRKFSLLKLPDSDFTSQWPPPMCSQTC